MSRPSRPASGAWRRSPAPVRWRSSARALHWRRWRTRWWAASDPQGFQAKLSAQDEELKKLRRELDGARMKSASASTENAAEAAVEVKGVKVLAQRVSGLDRNQMRSLVDTLRGRLGSGVVVLGAATEDGKVSLIAAVTKDLTSARCRRARSSARWRRRSAARAAAGPTLQRRAAAIPSQIDAAIWQLRRRRWARCSDSAALPAAAFADAIASSRRPWLRCSQSRPLRGPAALTGMADVAQQHGFAPEGMAEHGPIKAMACRSRNLCGSSDSWQPGHIHV